MFKDKRVVVTGGSGFVGTHYLQELLSRGANVVTHTNERPLQIQDDRIEVLENINLEKIDDLSKPAVQIENLIDKKKITSIFR